MGCDDRVRRPSGTRAGGQFATTIHPEPTVRLTSLRAFESAATVLQDALETRHQANDRVTEAALRLVALEVLDVCPDATHVILTEDGDGGQGSLHAHWVVRGDGAEQLTAELSDDLCDDIHEHLSVVDGFVAAASSPSFGTSEDRDGFGQVTASRVRVDLQAALGWTAAAA